MSDGPSGTNSYIENADRVAALQATNLLDRDVEPGLEQLTRLAQRLLNAPFAMISLVDQDRQVHKCQVGGLPAPWRSAAELPLSQSFCQYAITSRQPLIINDAREHPLVRDNLSTTQGGVGAYAGIPLAARGGHLIGTLCVLDSKPRDWSHEQIETLQSLAAAVMAWIAERSEAAQSGTQHGQASHNNVGDHDTSQPTGEALFQAASELIESLDAYDACISAPTGDTGLLAREAEARGRVIQAEQKLDATNQSLASSSESETNASTDKQHWAPLELLGASQEYFTSKARREDAVLRFQRGEVGVDTVEQEVLRTSSAEQGLRLAVRAYALEHGE